MMRFIERTPSDRRGDLLPSFAAALLNQRYGREHIVVPALGDNMSPLGRNPAVQNPSKQSNGGVHSRQSAGAFRRRMKAGSVQRLSETGERE
jgi:hypothetical protein